MQNNFKNGRYLNNEKLIGRDIDEIRGA